MNLYTPRYDHLILKLDSFFVFLIDTNLLISLSNAPFSILFDYSTYDYSILMFNDNIVILKKSFQKQNWLIEYLEEDTKQKIAAIK